MKQLLTIDTDNAIIRFYADRARAAGVSEEALGQLRTDILTLAAAVSRETGAQFRVEFCNSKAMSPALKATLS